MISVLTAALLATQTLFGPPQTTPQVEESSIETEEGAALLRQCVPSMLGRLTRVFRQHLSKRITACSAYLSLVKEQNDSPAMPYAFYERARLYLLDKQYDLARADIQSFRNAYQQLRYSHDIEDLSPIGADIMELLIDFRLNNPEDILERAKALSQKHNNIIEVHHLYVSLARHLDSFEHSLAADQYIERLQPSSKTVQRIALTQKLLDQPQAAADTLRSWFLVGPSRPELRSPILLYAAIQNDLGNPSVAANIFSLGENVSSANEISDWRDSVFTQHSEIADSRNWAQLKIRERDTVSGSSINLHVERAFAYLKSGQGREALAIEQKLPNKCLSRRCLEVKIEIAKLQEEMERAQELEKKLNTSLFSTEYKRSSKRDRELVKSLHAVPVERLLVGRPTTAIEATVKQHFSGDLIIKVRVEGPVEGHIIRQAMLASARSEATTQNAWGFIGKSVSTSMNYRRVNPDNDNKIEVVYSAGEYRFELIQSENNLAATLAPWRVTRAN